MLICLEILRSMSAVTTPTIKIEPLRRLFQPGNGVAPPFLAGREDVKSIFQDLSESLAEGWKINRDVILFGPRGNGKTVLLDECRRALKGRDVDLVNTTSAEIPTMAGLVSLLTAGGEPEAPSRLPGVNELHRVEQAGVGRSIAHMTMRRVDNVEAAARLKLHLLRRVEKRPLAVLLDEAHVLPPDVGRYLLNLSQSLRREGCPFALVMAGTPGLEAHLAGMEASFWERSEIVPVGRLSFAAAREAFVKPLESRGIGMAAEALDAAVEMSRQYPYFIQLWGEALCLRLEATSAARVTMETFRGAEEGVEEKQIRFYRRRFGEIRRAGLLSAALSVGHAFTNETALPRDALERKLASDLSLPGDQACEEIGKLIEVGYIWEPEGYGDAAPGIPSLMTHIAEEDAQRVHGDPLKPPKGPLFTP